MLPFTFAITALAALAGTADAYLFNQCASLDITSDVLIDLENAIDTLFSPANSYSGCPTYCITQGTTWSLYQPGLGGLAGTCFCTNTDPGGSFVVGSSNAAGACTTARYQINYLSSSPLEMAGCQTNPILGGGPAAVTTNSAGSCYSVCAAYAYAALTPANTGIFNCQCGMVLTPGTTANCDDNVAVVYRSTTVAPSGVARKRMLAARAAAERAALGDCPAGLTACRVPGGASSFECIDTQTELESCGGCSNGYYDDKKNLNATVGIDCSAINGVALGGSSCGGGKCKITRCRSGFDFENGACVRRLILPK